METLTLNCWVHGNDVGRIFPVEISRTKTVGDLKKVIQNEKLVDFRDIDPRALDLYRVSLARDEHLDEALKGLTLAHEKSLDLLDPLSRVFSDLPLEHVHIVIKMPLPTAGPRISGEHDILMELNKSFQRTCRLTSPDNTPSIATRSSEYMKMQRSVQRMYDVHYARDFPADTGGPPIQLFSPAFAYFSSKAFDPDYHVPPDFLCDVWNCMKGFSAIYHYKEHCAHYLRPLLEKVLERPFTMVQNHDHTIPDAVVLSSYKHYQMYLVISEEKNEFGGGRSDPSVQASFSFLRVHCQEQAEQLRNKCCCPTFLIAHAGPWLAILGGVITSELFSSGSRTSSGFLSTPLSMIINTSESVTHPRFFPTLDTYLRDGVPVRFKYLRPLNSRISCTTYLASTLEDKPIDVVVKFVMRYGVDVHREMATAGFAPNLLYHGPIDINDNLPSYGNLKMVVMEYVNGMTLHSAKEQNVVPAGFHSNLKQAIERLHCNDFVYGDLREPNILITGEGVKVLLINFDWAGKEGEVKYPASLSTSINWADGVGALELIQKQHDIAMLRLL